MEHVFCECISSEFLLLEGHVPAHVLGGTRVNVAIKLIKKM